MKYILLIFLSISQLHAEAPSLALLAGNDAARAAGELLIASRGGEGIVWVERDQREALLRERSVFLHHTRRDGQDFDLRRWVSADLLLVVETFEGEGPEQSQLWLRALDVVTGVRLAEKLLPVDLTRLEASVEPLDRVTRQEVFPAWRMLWKEEERFHGITLLDITLADATDAERRALAPVAELVQRMIVQQPGLLLVERELLGSLLDEEALSPALRLKLRSGGILLQGTLHREGEGPVFTLQGLSTDGEMLFENRIPLEEGRRRAGDVATAILRELHMYLEGGEIRPRLNLLEESGRFHQLALYYRSRSQSARALEAARTSWALDPRQARNADLLYELLFEEVEAKIRRTSRVHVAEIKELFRDIGLLMDFIPPRHVSQSGMRPEHLVRDVERRFREALEENPVLRERWRKARRGYERSVNYGRQRKYMMWTMNYDEFTEEERNRIFQHHADFYIPLCYETVAFVFGHRAVSEEPHMSPLPLEITLRLIEQNLERPQYSWKQKRPRRVKEDNLFLRNMILSVLYYTASRHEEHYVAHVRHHMEQLSVLLIEDPSRWRFYGYYFNLMFDPGFLSLLQLEEYHPIKRRIMGPNRRQMHHRRVP